MTNSMGKSDIGLFLRVHVLSGLLPLTYLVPAGKKIHFGCLF